MMRMDFYHLEKSNLDRELPYLIEKLLSEGWRVVILADSAPRVQYVNDLLWSFDSDKWLPHGAAKNGNAELQPVFITETLENPNGAEVLVLLGARYVDIKVVADKFKQVMPIFSAMDIDAVVDARKMWAEAKDFGGVEVFYNKK